MPWRDALEPTRMQRVALVSPREDLRRVLAAVADAGVVELERFDDIEPGPASEAWERAARELRDRDASAVSPALAPDAPDVGALARDQRMAELAGEAQLERVGASAVQRGAVAALVGWSPAAAVTSLADRLHPLGGAVVALPMPRGVEPPTLVAAGGATGAFQRLVDTYATVPYADLNPSVFAGLAYVVMFGMMFGDVGHGLLLLAAGLALWGRRPARLARFRWAAPFVVGAGLASAAFGLAYGDAFGPTGLVPVLWLAPLDHATTLLAVAVAAGAGLLAVSYGFGTVNRWREGGATHALVAVSGVAGVGMYAGVGLVGLGWYRHLGALQVGGGALALGGLVLGFLGLYAEAGGRASGVMQAGVELFDAVVRLGTNTVSFARLAAFGLTHAALGSVVWSGTSGLWRRGPALWAVAALVFVGGNAVAFLLEGLVAGVQALRLEYYELFSRVFTIEGRTFRPWHIPILTSKEEPCSPG
jgi:V/A-type H+-transporting ATPase subunit I